MKLIRFGAPGKEKPGIVDEQGTRKDVSAAFADWDLANLDTQLAKLSDPSNLPEADPSARLGPCVPRPGKIIAIGLNYADHAKETGAAIPAEPIIFMKATSSFSGPYDDVVIPRDSKTTDWEVELGVIIGHRARYVEKKDALGHVAGYCVIHDVSERDDQLKRGGQWVKGKSHDTFCPTGPWLVTADEISDPQNLRLWLEVDGKTYQDGNTKTMVFGVADLVAYLSRFMTLEPGDLITTGTPPGVGMGMKPPQYLAKGMSVRLGIEGLGEQKQNVV